MTIVLVKVKPSSRQSSFVAAADGSFVAQVKSAPVDGKANAELIALVARHFGCPRSAVSIRSGAGSRIKRIRIEDAWTSGLSRDPE